MTLKFIRPITIKHQIGTKVITQLCDATEENMKKYIGLNAIITKLIRDADTYGRNIIYEIDIDNGNNLWYKEELKFIK